MNVMTSPTSVQLISRVLTVMVHARVDVTLGIVWMEMETVRVCRAFAIILLV